MTEEVAQTTLRDALTASFDEIETGGSPIVEEVKTDRVRDEGGKFAKAETPVEAKPAEVAPVEVKTETPAPVSDLVRPTTWKKEYLPIWDKLSTGAPLTPDEASKLARYSQQRENEYKSGVSTYKAEAEQAKHLQEAIAPFMPALQQHGIEATHWIKNLGAAHQTLALGSPEQKLQMFAKLAQDYGVPLNMITQSQQGPVDQTVLQLMQEIQNLKGQVSGVSSWREQQESAQIQQQISQFEDASKYPHFGFVRGTMAQLLESGKAQDLQQAYEMAAEPIEEMIKARLEQAAPQVAQQRNMQAVQQAKAKAVSVKSVTPSGTVNTSTAKDRRSMLTEQVESLMGGARV